MKRFLNWRNASMAFVAASLVVLAAGSDDPNAPVDPENPPVVEVPGEDLEAIVKELAEKYFFIEDAEFVKGEFPQGTTSTNLEGITINNKALTGGMNYVTVVSAVKYDEFYVGIAGVDGYFKFRPNPENIAFDEDTYMYTFTVPMVFGPDYNINITVLISAMMPDGYVTPTVEETVEHVESLPGDLHVNLTFNNEKDVDLHLITPDGTRIYYGNRGGSVELSDNSVIEYGLDHDSNAACNIDGLNNENIVIPAALIQPGLYTVIVDMYANCDPSIATSWSVVTRYKDAIIPASSGSNPVSGTYPAYAPSGDQTVVMQFEITDGESSSRSADRLKVKEGTFKATPLNKFDLLKLEWNQ